MDDLRPKSSQGSIFKLIVGISLLAAASLIMVACSDFTINGTIPTPGASKVTVVVSDPATCQSPNGPYSHVYVTIADVRANQSDSAGLNDLGWVDVTPDLSSAPMQVDLLGTPDNHCFLATLGEKLDMQPGTYKQFRIFLAPDNATIASNACGNSANCVVLASDSSVHRLEISGEATNGIVLTASEILYGGLGVTGFVVSADQSTTLNINFLACESIVQDEQGAYRLKPVLTAGDAKPSPNTLHGEVVDGVTGQAVKGKVIVALERQDGTGASKIVRTILADADGSFVFCPRPSGSYDVVIVGTGADGTFYQPSILIYVGTTADVGKVKLFPVTPAADSMVTLTGKVTTQTGTLAPTPADLILTILEKTADNITFTIPIPPTSTQSSATLALATAPSSGNLTCPAKSYCADFSIQLPAGSANSVDFRKHGTRLSPNDTLATYVIDMGTFIPLSGGVLNCSALPIRTGPITPSAGGETVMIPTFRIAHCQ